MEAKTLISHLPSSRRFALPDFNKPFFCITDASVAEVGLTLSQRAAKSKWHQVIACYSHRFTPIEQGFPVQESELCVTWRDVHRCMRYLDGMDFSVQADRQSLMHLTKSFQGFDNYTAARRLGRPMEYDFTNVCIEKVTNALPDACSCRPISSPTCAPTVLLCDDLRVLSKLPCYVLDVPTTTVKAKLNIYRHMQHYCVEDDLL